MTDQVLTGVGARLQEAREAAGLAIDDVARQLKLLPRQVESLEHERFERLPGPAIARGMVRNYARLLGLDPEPLVERMAPREEARPRSAPPSAVNRRSTLLYATLAVVLLALAGAWAWQWQREKAPPESAPAAPRPAAPRPAEPAFQPPAAPAEKPVEQPDPEPAASEPPPAATPGEAEAPVEPKPQAAAQPVLPPGVHRLVLRVEEEAWLEVRDGSGRSLVSSLNPAGSERAVRGQPPFDLVIGNARHVRLTYDGKPVDLEPHIKGQVARFTLP